MTSFSERTGAWYALIYGTASYYSNLRFEAPGSSAQATALAERRPSDDVFLDRLGTSLAGGAAGADGGAAGADGGAA